jgi:hypothetical protein
MIPSDHWHETFHQNLDKMCAQMIRFLPLLRFTFEGALRSSRGAAVNLGEGGDHDHNTEQSVLL